MEEVAVPDWMVLNALRYALGRHSYVVSETAEQVRALWPKLSARTRQVILRDLDEFIERDGPLGRMYDIDMDTWKALRRSIN